MKCKSHKIINSCTFWLIIFCVKVCFTTNAQYFINAESGVLFTGLNDIRNGKDATFISLKDDLKSPVSPFLRLRFGVLINQKHHFSILYAPLQLTAKGTINSDVLFDGEIFVANVPLEAVYRFNSYRFTYNRRIITTDNFQLGIGVSAKVRDAGSSLENSNLFKEDFNIGFVPLINVISNYKISDKFGVQLFGEGLAAARGRALDIALTGTYTITKNLQGNLGYRILDGGSNGINSYNFVQFHFAVLSLTYTFTK